MSVCTKATKKNKSVRKETLGEKPKQNQEKIGK